MTLEDSKRISIVIGSQDSIDSLERGRMLRANSRGEGDLGRVPTANGGSKIVPIMKGSKNGRKDRQHGGLVIIIVFNLDMWKSCDQGKGPGKNL